MTTVSARTRAGVPKPRYAANPFDSDDDVPATAPTTSQSRVSKPPPSSSSASHSGGYTNPFDDGGPSGGSRAKSHSSTDRRPVQSTNPFDDDAPPHGRRESHFTADHRLPDASNPFDDDYSPPKPFKQIAKGNKMKPEHSNHSSSSQAASNPFDADFEATSKPKTRGDNILDKGSLFDDEDQPARMEKERKSSTRTFTARVKEGGARIKETASSSLSNVKLPTLPTLPSSSASARLSDEKLESKGGKSKQQSKDLFGEPELFQSSSQPFQSSSQQNSFTQSETRLEDQSVEQLEQYALNKSQDTTSSIKNAIKIAEDTKGIATKTLETLHNQGQQIRRTHNTAVRVEEELGRGEKLLGSLGGIFSMTWKPKKGHKITGPQVDPDQYKRTNNIGGRNALGLTGEATRSRPDLSGLSSTQAQLQVGKNTQDDALSDLSNVLGQLKGMTVDMGHEIERQNGDLDRMEVDVQELNARVKGANNRTRHLLRR